MQDRWNSTSKVHSFQYHWNSAYEVHSFQHHWNSVFLISIISRPLLQCFRLPIISNINIIGTVNLNSTTSTALEHHTQTNPFRTTMADDDISPYIIWLGNAPCPWIMFYTNALTLLDTLYDETCSPQTKITKFINAAKRRFARSPTRGKKPKKQVKKVIHIPGVSISKQKDMAFNRQSCQPIATSCKDRSPTPHPHIRSKADTRELHQPTPNSYRARSPTPPPWGCSNANVRTFSQSITMPLQKDNHSFHINTIQLHHGSPHSTESQSINTKNSSLQDQFRCIPGPSTRKCVNSSCIPIPSKLWCHNLASSNKNKPQSCYKGVSHIPVPHGRKKHIVKSTTKDNAYKDASILSDTASVHDRIEMPRDTTTTNRVHNSQGDTKANTQDQDVSATVQPKQHRTPQPTKTSPPMPTLSSQNTHNHKKQYITRPLSATNNTRPSPLLPKAATSRPKHMANSKQQPALIPTPACWRSPTMPSNKQQLPVLSPMFNHFTSPAYYGAVTKVPHHTPLYLLVIILTLTDEFTKLLCQQGNQDTIHQKQYIHRGIQTDTITPLWRTQAELKYKLELKHKLNSNILSSSHCKWSLQDHHDSIYHLLYNFTFTGPFNV